MSGAAMGALFLLDLRKITKIKRLMQPTLKWIGIWKVEGRRKEKRKLKS
jgi:hypothetical protein